LSTWFGRDASYQVNKKTKGSEAFSPQRFDSGLLPILKSYQGESKLSARAASSSMM